MIAAHGLGKRFGDKRVLRNVDLCVTRGGFAVVTPAARRSATSRTNRSSIAS
jgi:ABC-type transporter Mla maintaining outer membrane lipid asymmetry ATPase subunit MlaF